MLEEPHLALELDPHEHGIVVRARGAIDLVSSPQLRDMLLSPEAQAAIVVLDLTAVEFIDSSGLHVILERHEHARAADVRFAVAIRGSARSVQRMFEVSGVTALLELVDTPQGLVGDRSAAR